MKKGLIVLDWDHTLFNTTQYINELKVELLKLGVSEEEFDTKRQFVKDCCHVIDIDNFAYELSGVDPQQVHVANEAVLQRSNEFIYDDVPKFLRRNFAKFDILILTQGDAELQNAKFHYSNLPQEIPFKVTQKAKNEPLSDVVGEYDKVYVIDDKPVHLSEVKKLDPGITTLFMQRPNDKPYASNDAKDADRIVENLDVNLK